MAHRFHPHYDNVRGFTFPITVEVLNEIGAPTLLLRIPQPDRDALVATLAIELSATARAILMKDSPRKAKKKFLAELHRKYGGERLEACAQESAALNQRIAGAKRELDTWDRHTGGLYDYGRDETLGTDRSVGPSGHVVRWLYDRSDPEYVHEARTKVAVLNEIVINGYRRVIELESLRRKIVEEIESRSEYKSEEDAWTWRFNIDFSSAGEYQCFGAAFLLRNLEYSWWVSFTTSFEDRVRKSWRASIKVALRDTKILQEVREDLDGNCFYDAYSDYLNRGPWKRVVGSKSPGAIKIVRGLLLKEDESSMRWLKKMGRARNFYTQWVAEVLANSDGAKYWVGPTSSKWKDRLQCFVLAEKAEENEELRINELAWCLTVGAVDPYQFQYFGSASEEWESHFKTWWPALMSRMGKS